MQFPNLQSFHPPIKSIGNCEEYIASDLYQLTVNEHTEVHRQNLCVTSALPKPPVDKHTHCTIKYDEAKFKGHLD